MKQNWTTGLFKPTGVVLTLVLFVIAVWACEGLPGRMTGGGSIFPYNSTDVVINGGTDITRVTHGFEIHCLLGEPNNLEINWSGNRFHLTDLTYAYCTYDPAGSPKPPAAGFNTFYGEGIGLYNGMDGYSIRFTLTDFGEPGNKDTANIYIYGPDGTVIDTGGPIFLTFGNQQAHKD